MVGLRAQDPDVEANYRVDSVLCLVDAKNIEMQLQRIPTEEGTVWQERVAGGSLVHWFEEYRYLAGVRTVTMHQAVCFMRTMTIRH